MYATYKLMQNCTNSQYMDKELEELVLDYRKTESITKRNKIVAAMFVKVFPMILKIQSKYYSLTNEQKVEHALFHLIRSIKYYKNNNVKFSSFFHTHLTNQMKTLLTSQNNLKNAVFQNIVRDNENVLNWYIKTKAAKGYEDSEEYMVDMIKNSTKLSSEEKQFCELYLKGYNKMQQISEKMNINKGVTDPIKIMTQTPEEIEKQKKRDLRKVRKIKQSLIEKYKKYGSEIFC